METTPTCTIPGAAEYLIASFIRSGINGNATRCCTSGCLDTSIASFIRSGINGNLELAITKQIPLNRFFYKKWN